MAPPVYSDLGKLARDVFKRGYHPGLWVLDCKTKTNSGIEFSSLGVANQDASKVSGSIQSKYKVEDYGLILTERWSTDNFLFGEIMQKDKLAEGLMLALNGQFLPSSGEGYAKFKIGYAKEHFNFLAEMNLDLNGPIMDTSLVLSHKEFLGGVGFTFDSGAGELSSYKFALGWFNEKATVHVELQNGDSWLASLFHKLNEKTDTAIELLKAGGGGREEGSEEGAGSDMTLGVGLVYHLEGDAMIRAKINTDTFFGLGYEQKLREGISFTISTVLEGKNLSEGDHKLGLGFALEV